MGTYFARLETCLIQHVKKDGTIVGIEINDFICGNCGSVLYGYDEVICPVCGENVNFDLIDER
jgi:hypothetical protein